MKFLLIFILSTLILVCCKKETTYHFSVPAIVTLHSPASLNKSDTFWLQMEIPFIVQDLELSNLTVQLKDFVFSSFYVSFTYLQKNNFDIQFPTPLEYPVVGRYIKIVNENGETVSMHDDKMHWMRKTDSSFIWRVGIVGLDGFSGIIKARFFPYSGQSTKNLNKAFVTPIIQSNPNAFLMESIVGSNFQLDPSDIYFRFK